MRRRRALTTEEQRIWAQVARSVKPMPGNRMPPEPLLPPPSQISAAPTPPAPAFQPPPVPRPRLPPLTGIERKTARRLRRGTGSPEARIDLHGMRQEEAYLALLGFLARSQRAGAGLVLVITGKGGPAGTNRLFDERGILRRMVPHWLSLPDMRATVLGFEEAGQGHGGAGALYVRLRRLREGSP